MAIYRKIKNFLTSSELSNYRKIVDGNMGEAHETFGRMGLGPRYRVIDGDQIRKLMPEVQALGDKRVLPIVEEFAGKKVSLMPSSKRSMRIQQYSKKDHGFRWHCDGHPYVALVALKNTNRGQTHLISARLSWFLRYPLYPIRFFDRLCGAFPYESTTMEAGDMLILNGGISVHRAVTLDEGGEKLTMVYGYDEVGKKLNPLQDRFARRLNY